MGDGGWPPAPVRRSAVTVRIPTHNDDDDIVNTYRTARTRYPLDIECNIHVVSLHCLFILNLGANRWARAMGRNDLFV